MKSSQLFAMLMITPSLAIHSMSGVPMHMKETADGRCEVYSGDVLREVHNKPCADVEIRHNFLHFSDARLKENAKELKPSLSKLVQVPLYQYNFIGRSEKEFGVFAHELQQYFPDLVVDSFSESKMQGYKQVNYLGLGVMALQALKEANKKIDALEARVAELEQAR